MIIFVCILGLVCLLNIKYDETGKGYLDIKRTNSIKGIFIVLVFLSHIVSGYATFNGVLDMPYLRIRKIMGQCVVSMFLFYSGYGIMESIQRKGQNYINKIPTHRFLKVLLQFDCAILFFLIYRYYTGNHIGLKRMILTFIGLDSIGNSNWYIFCGLWVYIFTFIAFKVFKNNYFKGSLGVLLLSLFYMITLYKFGKDFWWYDTILCCSWGMLFSIYHKKIEALINESFQTWLFFVVVFMVGFGFAYTYKNTPSLYIIYQLMVICFVATIVTVTMRIAIENSILQWLGNNLFELYILQRLPMMILKPYMLVEDATLIKKYLYVIVCFASTLLISLIFSKTVSKVISNITNRF